MPGSLTFSTNYYTRARTQSLSRALFSPLHVVNVIVRALFSPLHVVNVIVI